MATLFSKIAAGEIPSYKCAEDDRFYAFLDINPVKQGHTLVIPRKEVDYIFDMSDDDLAAFEVFAKKVAKAIRTAFPCKKVAEVVLGLEVNHAHIHLIPIDSEADVDFHHHVKLSHQGMGRAKLRGVKFWQRLINPRPSRDIYRLHILIHELPFNPIGSSFNTAKKDKPLSR